MAVTVYKTFSAGEVLTAADLNNSFLQVANNDGLTTGGTITGDFTMSGASVVETEGAAVASATTTNIWATDGNTVHITGTTTITSFGTAPQAGAWMKVVFDDVLTLTHAANLNLPGSANITTAAGDFAFVYADTTTQFDVLYFPKSGAAVVQAAAAAGTLTGTTLAANVVSSSLTSVGTIATGVWQGTVVGITYGGTGASSASAAATALGLGTLDSPMFTAVNVGHATDTTLTRVSAGVLAVEGNTIYAAGGTDVPVTDGGTGASTAAGAATNLGLGTGDSPQFTAVNIGHATDTTITRTGAGDIAVEGNTIYRAGGTDVPVTDGGTGASTASGALTNLAARGQGTETIWVPANAMIARTTNGAASGTTESTTNKVMSKTLDFDTTTQEFAQFTVRFPKSWNNGTVTFAPYWTAASGSGGVVFGLAGVALSNDDAIDTAYGTAQTSTDTLITALDVHVGPTSAAITIAGTPATADWVSFQINRTVSDGSDTLGVDALLMGVALFFTTNAVDDT